MKRRPTRPRSPHREENIVFKYIESPVIDLVLLDMTDIVLEQLIGCCSIIIETFVVAKKPVIAESVSMHTPPVAP
jgi:hypothetical protein